LLTWSPVNKKIESLESRGQMTPIGRAKILAAMAGRIVLAA